MILIFSRHTSKHAKAKRLFTLVLTITFLISCITPFAAVPDETLQMVFFGTDSYDTVINNLAYTDVRISNTWAKEAIYETGALDLLKGFEKPIFGLKKNLTKEEALSFVYILAGREADAQAQGEALNAARAANLKKTDPMEVWMDGYLKLAADEGLISAQDFADSQAAAATVQQNPLSFNRYSSAQRQEVAYWLAMALGMAPVYGQQKIFNSFSDWRQADPEKIPYIEAILQKNIMNGNSNKSFNPALALTREEAAQIAGNAENELFPSLGYSRLSGVIEKITPVIDQSLDKLVMTENIDIRNSGGGLHRVVTKTITAQGTSGKNENDGQGIMESSTGLVVLKKGVLGNGNLLAPGDVIEYITASDRTVKFVNVISDNNNYIYKAIRLTGVKQDKQSITIDKAVQSAYPGIDYYKLKGMLEDTPQIPEVNLVYSSKLTVRTGDKPAELTALKLGTMAVITLRGNIVTEINVPQPVREEEPGTYSGIVEDNNPQLGYITLYKDDGTGSGASGSIELITLRTFNYAPLPEVNVLKNYKQARPEDISSGDSVFLKLDDQHRVVMVSGVSNYTPKCGTVISKKPSSISVRYDDGSNQLLPVDSKVVFISDGRIVGYDTLQDGDRVRLLLEVTPQATVLKEVKIEGDEHFISNIYKGTVTKLNTISKEATIRNMEVFDHGQWKRTDVNAFTNVRFAEEYSLYDGNSSLSAETAAKYYSNRNAYLAVEKDYGGRERIVVLSYLNDADREVVLDDKVASSNPGSGKFTLTGSFNDMNFGRGSIIVKDGRLVTGLSITNQDKAYIAASRNYGNGSYFAGIVEISERMARTKLDIYRGRIKSINENRDFSLESFSKLEGTSWKYVNTPKTFKITYDTRILDDNGVTNQRDFISYGAQSYIDKVVYVIAENTEATLISTAPFGPEAAHVKGKVYDMPGLKLGQDGKPIQEPTGLNLTGVKVYNSASYIWINNVDMKLNLLKNTIVLRGDNVISPSEIKKGEEVSVYQKGNGVAGDAYIIQVIE